MSRATDEFWSVNKQLERTDKTIILILWLQIPLTSLRLGVLWCKDLRAERR